MYNNYVPQYDLKSRISGPKLDTAMNMQPMRLNSIDSPENPTSFKDVLGGMVQDFNNTVNAPDNLLKDLMAGNKNVDYHDVMVAMSQAEITVNVATQVVGKVINAYDRVMQISI